MRVSYKEIKHITKRLGYNSEHVHNNVSCIDFLEQEGFVLNTINGREWDLEFESPQAELMFAIKYSDVLYDYPHTPGPYTTT